jgi:hypothetical protein
MFLLNITAHVLCFHVTFPCFVHLACFWRTVPIWPVDAGEELDFVCETDTRLLLCGLNSGPNKDVSRMKAVVATKNTANCMILFSF